MTRYYRFLLALILSVGLVLPFSTAEMADKEVPAFQVVQDLGAYRITKYDVLDLSIVGFPDENWMSQLVVGPDGYVNLPYTGSIKLAGLTIPEAANVLKGKLSEYLSIPELAVIIKQYGPRQVYVMGAVNKEGIYSLPSDKMNVFAALSSAGGITPKGRAKHIAVVRVVGDTVLMKEVNFDAFVKTQDIAQNLWLQDGDMVYVPESGKLIFEKEILPVLTSTAVIYNYTKK